MEDYEATFNVLREYSKYLDTQFDLVKHIKENKTSLENVLGTSPNIQCCANELEADFDVRLNYFFEYVETLLKSEELGHFQRKELEWFRNQVFKYSDVRPLLEVKYTPK